MKYNVFLWGIGTYAKRILKGNTGGWFQLLSELNILGYIDNNSKNWGEVFENRPIYSPAILKNTSFDYIIILSVYENEIKKQLKQDYGITEDQVYNIRTFIQLWSRQSDNSALKKDVILWNSDWKEWEDLLVYFKIWFHPIAFGTRTAKNFTYKKMTLPIVSLESLGEGNNIFILISEIDYQQNKNYFNELNINDNKIIILDEKSIYRTIYNNYCTITTSFGKLYPEETFYLILYPWPRTGFCGALLYFISHILFAKHNNWIPIIDAQNFPNQYIKEGRFGIDNSWNYYFYPLNKYSLDEIYHSKNVIIAGSSMNIPLNINDSYSVNQYYEIWEQLVMMPELKNYIQLLEKKFKLQEVKSLGVLFRGTDYVNRKPNGSYIQPELNQIIDKVQICLTDWNCEKIFLCTEVQEAVEAFEICFPGKVNYISQLRFPENTNEWLYQNARIKNQNNGYLIGFQYFAAIYLLSTCNCLVAGNTSGSQMALVLNHNNYENKYIFNLGTYGM